MRRAASLAFAVLLAEAFAFPFAFGGILQAQRCPKTLKKQLEKKGRKETVYLSQACTAQYSVIHQEMRTFCPDAA